MPFTLRPFPESWTSGSSRARSARGRLGRTEACNLADLAAAASTRGYYHRRFVGKRGLRDRTLQSAVRAGSSLPAGDRNHSEHLAAELGGRVGPLINHRSGCGPGWSGTAGFRKGRLSPASNRYAGPRRFRRRFPRPHPWSLDVPIRYTSEAVPFTGAPRSAGHGPYQDRAVGVGVPSPAPVGAKTTSCTS